MPFSWVSAGVIGDTDNSRHQQCSANCSSIKLTFEAAGTVALSYSAFQLNSTNKKASKIQGWLMGLEPTST
jgi:hypothetical protein